MTFFVIQVLVHLVCFGLAFYALQALDFNRFLKQGRTVQGQLLYIFLSMALGFLMAQFIMKLCYYFYY